MSRMCQYQYPSSQCSRPATTIRYAVDYYKAVRSKHLCDQHAKSYGYASEEELWATLITEELTQ